MDSPPPWAREISRLALKGESERLLIEGRAPPPS